MNQQVETELKSLLTVDIQRQSLLGGIMREAKILTIQFYQKL